MTFSTKDLVDLEFVSETIMSTFDFAGQRSRAIRNRQLPIKWGAHGDVAQLEEHLLCKQGVVGSSPIISTPRYRL